jgi:hypothetical protein
MEPNAMKWLARSMVVTAAAMVTLIFMQMVMNPIITLYYIFTLLMLGFVWGMSGEM